MTGAPRSLVFWQLRTTLAPLLAPDCRVVPAAMSLHGTVPYRAPRAGGGATAHPCPPPHALVMLVRFTHLQTTQMPVGSAAGVSMAPFDALFESLDEFDVTKNVWEYEVRAWSAKNPGPGFLICFVAAVYGLVFFSASLSP